MEEDLDRLVGPHTRALHIIHYWGFTQDAGRWRNWCDDRGLVLIEDGAQALLSSRDGKEVGSSADLAVFCLYKSFGLPDGAAAICASDLPAPRSDASLGSTALARRVGSALTARSEVLARVRAAVAPEREAARSEGEFLEGEFELGDPFRPPTILTSRLLSRVVDPRAAVRRRKHYEFLLERLNDRVPVPFDSLPEGAVPIAFPIEVEHGLQQAAALRRHGIMAGVLWPTRHPEVPAGNWDRADFFRDHVLALPVHQQLTAEQLERIANTATRLPVRNRV
jgi:dTDP-4-amino-4,6-dideoxygalactose transaminase